MTTEAQTITIEPGTCPACGSALLLEDINVSVRQPGLVEYVFSCGYDHVGNPKHRVYIDVAREPKTVPAEDALRLLSSQQRKTERDAGTWGSDSGGAQA